MNKLEALSARLEEAEIKTLKKYYEMVKEQKKQHFGAETIHDKSVLKSLAALGFVKFEIENTSSIPQRIELDHYLTLFPSALDRAEFEFYGPLRKWLVMNSLKYKDWMAVVAFILSAILTVQKIFEYYLSIRK